MSASQNGWRVLSRAECVTIDVPGGQLPVHPKLAPIFADLAGQYHATVEPLTWPGCWGWADRPIAGSKTTSNHASGTAIDLCAPAHPQGVAVSKTFTKAQLTACLRLQDRYHGLIVWGGTWNLPDTDGMHWELRQGATEAEVDAVAATLAPRPAPAPPAPTPPPAPAGPDLTGVGPLLRGDVGNTGPRVAALQSGLATRYPAYRNAHGGLVADGVWGPITTAWLAEFGHRSSIPETDGRNIGPKLALALFRAGIRP